MADKFSTKKVKGLELPILGLGTYRLGGRYELTKFALEKGAKLIQAAFELGYTHLDTAERYVYGKAEEMIGLALKKGLSRDEVFITTKVAGNHLSYDEVIAACEQSLARMSIEQVDLYLIHWPDKSVPLKETMRAMDFLLENEMIRRIGVSNFDAEFLKEAVSQTKHQIVNNQIHYNVAARAYEEDGTLDYCEENDILVTAYSPLGDVATGNLAESDNEILQRLADKYGKTSAQICINWVISKPNVVTLAKSSNPEHMEENFQAVLFEMEDSDIKDLDENFPRSETNIVR